jgi:hypothetical protein
MELLTFYFAKNMSDFRIWIGLIVFLVGYWALVNLLT